VAIETGEHFTLDEVREMIEAADENGEWMVVSSLPMLYLGLVGDGLKCMHMFALHGSP
jgi:hypothetical protein